MSEEKQDLSIYGVLMGLLGNEHGPTHVGFNFNAKTTVVLPIEAAGLMFVKLGEILDDVGYFEDDDEEVPVEESQPLRKDVH